jgi:hypothetical protein
MATNIRRVVTGHDKTGKAIVIQDGEPPRKRELPAISQALLWVTDKTPATNKGDADGGNVDIGIPPPANGSVFRVIDFQPETGAHAAPAHTPAGVETPKDSRHPGMHRTKSIDYAIVMEGEIDMLLDDSEVHLKAGDVVIQRGTYHAWANRSGKPCRVFFVLIDADPL